MRRTTGGWVEQSQDTKNHQNITSIFPFELNYYISKTMCKNGNSI